MWSFIEQATQDTVEFQTICFCSGLALIACSLREDFCHLVLGPRAEHACTGLPQDYQRK